MIIFWNPFVKSCLCMGYVVDRPAADDLQLQRPVEPLILALRLRVVGVAVARAHAQPQQPDGQVREGPGVWVTPQGEPLSISILRGKP